MHVMSLHCGSHCHGSKLAQGTWPENCSWPSVGRNLLDHQQKQVSDTSVQLLLSTAEPDRWQNDCNAPGSGPGRLREGRFQ